MSEKNTNTSVNRAKMYQLVLFPFNNGATNVYYILTLNFIAYYGNGVLGLALMFATTMVTAMRLFDAVTDPIIGALIDKTQTKWGKCRPYILLFSVPVCLFAFLQLCVPEIGKYKALYCGIIYVLFSIFFAIVNVAYSTLLSLITDDNKERIKFNTSRMLGANIGGMIVTAFTLTIVTAWEKTGSNGYSFAALLYSILFFVALLLCGIFTKERFAAETEEKVKISSFCSASVKSKNWIIYCIAMFLCMFFSSMHNQSTIYYMQYYVGNADLSSFVLSVSPFACVLAAIIMPKVALRIGMKNTICIGNVIYMISLLGTWLVGKRVLPVILLSITTSIGWAVTSSMIFVMLAQLIDCMQVAHHIRPQGTMTSVATFLMKMGGAVAGFAGPLILKAGGYAEGSVVTDKTIFVIQFTYILLPLIVSGVVLVLMKFFSLDKEYGRIQNS